MNNFKPFLYGIAATLLATIIAIKYFPGHETMAICAFVAIGLGSFMNEILSFNRDAIWGKELSSYVANKKLAFEITGIFGGIFLTALTLYLSAGYYEELNIKEIYSNNFLDLLLHNFQVLSVCILLAFIYRAGGIVLIMSWNAINWAEAIGHYLSLTTIGAGYKWSSLLGVALLPHLICEALSYILGGMSGLFLSKAVFKYKLLSLEFRQVYMASFKILCLSAFILLIGALFEIYLGQSAFHIAAFRGASSN